MVTYPSIGLPVRRSGRSSRVRATTPITSPITSVVSRPGTCSMVTTGSDRETSVGFLAIGGCGVHCPGCCPYGGGCWAYGGGCWPYGCGPDGCPYGCCGCP